MHRPSEHKHTTERRKRKPVLGLLGGPGSGKSFVARLFEREGAAVIDADRLAREAMEEPGVRDQIRQWWGDEVLDEAGQVDRRAVAARVFERPEALRRLEGLIHPRVRERRAALRSRYEGDADVVAIVEDCPLLIEQGLDADCDVLVFVETPLSVRQSRVKQTRGWSAEVLAAREKNQASLDMKRNRADYVIDNSVAEPAVHKQVRNVLRLTLQHIAPNA